MKQSHLIILFIVAISLSAYNWFSIQGLKRDNRMDAGRYVSPGEIGMQKHLCSADLEYGQVVVFQSSYSLNVPHRGVPDHGARVLIQFPSSGQVDNAVSVRNVNFLIPDAEKFPATYTINMPGLNLGLTGYQSSSSFESSSFSSTPYKGEMQFAPDTEVDKPDSWIKYQMRIMPYHEAKDIYPNIPEMPNRGGGWEWVQNDTTPFE